MKSPLPLCLFLLYSCPFLAQAPVGDCLGAIPVCQQIYEETQSPQGGGNVLEINGEFNCMQSELNSSWYSFTVNQSGDFGFLLTPNDLLDDYDWALFDITNANCEDLFDNPDLIVSCNAAGGTGCIGPTGANGDTSFDDQGFNCGINPPSTFQGFSAFNDLVPVEEGNTYVLVVSNWSNSPNGYTIDFGLSSDIGIFDEESPEIASLQLPEDCAENEIELLFSEFIQCNSIDASNFELTGPGGPYTLALSSVNCDAGGNFAKEFLLTINPSITQLGDFVLMIDVNGSSEVLDLCNNAAQPTTFPFSAEDLFVPLNLGEDRILCDGESLVLDATFPDATYEWQDGSSNATFEVFIDGIYAVTVTSNCGTNVDSVEIVFMEGVPPIDLGNDTTLCPGASLILDITTEGATYLWEDGSTSPVFTVSQSGTYAVSVNSACEEQETMISVDYYNLIENSIQDYSLCEGESLILDATFEDATYLWNNGSTGPTLEITAPGNYEVTVMTSCETAVFNSMITVVAGAPVFELGADTTLCFGETLQFDFNGTGDNFLWQDGSIEPGYTMEVTGDYAVTISNGCGESTDRIFVEVFESINFDIGRDTFLCPGEQLFLDATSPGATFYQWRDGSTNPIVAIDNEGVYTVTVGNDCEELMQTINVLECEICDVFVPNAFSPNDDGINDLFQPFSDCVLENFKMQIFDRWGALLYESEDYVAGWNGKVKGGLLNLGIYVWVLEYTVIENNQARKVQRSGDILLIKG